VTVQRLFSMFPAGWAGAALVLLRASICATLIADGAARFSPGIPSWLLPGILVQVFFLLAGLFTPHVCVASCLFQLGACFFTSGYEAFHLLISTINTAVLAVLGPGAYSIDARLFGRRILTLDSSGRRGR